MAQLIERAPAREHCQPCDRPARLTALHCGVIRWWDPSAPPDRQGSLGPDRHPSGATEDSIRSPFSGLGGLLHTSPGNRLAKPARGAPSPFTSSFACRTPLKRMGICPPYGCDPSASSSIKNYYLQCCARTYGCIAAHAGDDSRESGKQLAPTAVKDAQNFSDTPPPV